MSICRDCGRVAPPDYETGASDELCPTCRDLEEQDRLTPRDLVDHAAHTFVDVCADLMRAIYLADSEPEMARILARILPMVDDFERVAHVGGQRHEALSRRAS